MSMDTTSQSTSQPGGIKQPAGRSTAGALFPKNERAPKTGLTGALIGLGLLAVSVIGFFLSPNVAVAGIWCIAMMIILLFLGMPVALSLALPSLIGIYGIAGIPASINVLANSPFHGVASWEYSVLPMFIFMGMLLNYSGMTSKIYSATAAWFNWLPGGIGVSTTAAGAGLSSVSGSTIGMTYALGRAGIPEMLKAGYDRRMAVGTVIVSGLPGNLIPPSVLMVVYAGIAGVAVGPQLMAGAVPGLLLAVTFGLFIMLMGVIKPSLVGRGRGGKVETFTWGERFRRLADVWGFPVIMIVLIGGLFSGLFTPTEAGAAAALTALLLAFVYARGNQPLARIREAAFATVTATAAIFFIIIGAGMLTRLLAITGLAQMVTDAILSIGLTRISFLIVIIVMYLIMGMFFDTLSMMLLTIPILLPTLEAMEVSPLWFGVFVVLLGELGMVTPPVGILSYIVHAISQEPEVNQGHTISLKDVFTSLLWFLPIAVLFLIIMILFPQMATWLPGLMS